MLTVQIVVGIAAMALIIGRQLLVRPLRTDRRLRVVGVLGLIGVVQVIVTVSGQPASALGWELLIVGMGVGAGLGVLRARTMRVWWRSGELVTQGTAVTVALWIVGMAAHVGLDLWGRAVDPGAEALSSASILLFVAVSLGAQLLAMTGRLPARPAVEV